MTILFRRQPPFGTPPFEKPISSASRRNTLHSSQKGRGGFEGRVTIEGVEYEFDGLTMIDAFTGLLGKMPIDHDRLYCSWAKANVEAISGADWERAEIVAAASAYLAANPGL